MFSEREDDVAVVSVMLAGGQCGASELAGLAWRNARPVVWLQGPGGAHLRGTVWLVQDV